MEPLSSDNNLSDKKPESKLTLILRFLTGAIIGLAIAGLNWWGTIYFFDYHIALSFGILGCVLLAIICGLLTLKWGYKTIEVFLQNIY